MIQRIELVYARLVVTEPDELDGNVFLGATFVTHALHEGFDEPSDVIGLPRGLPLGVRQDVEAQRPLRLGRRLASEHGPWRANRCTEFIYMLLQNGLQPPSHVCDSLEGLLVNRCRKFRRLLRVDLLHGLGEEDVKAVFIGIFQHVC